MLDRLKERHIGLEKMASEVSKVEGLAVSVEGLTKILRNNKLAGAYLLAAAKLDDDYKKNLLPTDFTDWTEESKCFSACPQFTRDCSNTPNYDFVDLPPFLKHALIKIVKSTQSEH